MAKSFLLFLGAYLYIILPSETQTFLATAPSGAEPRFGEIMKMDEKKAREMLDKEVTKLKEVSVTSINECIVAEYLAISDKAVQEKFLHKIAEGCIFRGIRCLSGISIPETRRVEFRFDCPSGAICLVPPSFMVVVNMISKHVEQIVDPYIEDDVRQATPINFFGDGMAGWGQQPPEFVFRSNQYFESPGGWPRSTQSPYQVASSGYAPWGGPAYLTPQNVRVELLGDGRGVVHAEVMVPNGCFQQAQGVHRAPGGIMLLPEQVGITLPVLYVPRHSCPMIVQTFEYNVPFAYTEGKTSAAVFVTMDNMSTGETRITGEKTVAFHRVWAETRQPVMS
jgi:hypothetical protein